MSNLFNLLIITVSLTTLLTACDNDDPNDKDNTTVFKTMLVGPSEVPSTYSLAIGATTLTFNESTKRFVAVTTYTGLTPTAGHIHNAPAGVNGDVVFSFEITASPITYQSVVLTQQQINELFNGRMYVNLHTAEYPEGEIRGQLIKQ